jgi:dienelactone hydrolase
LKARVWAGSALALVALVPLTILLAAVPQRVDVARMLLAANGSIVRGFVVASVAGAALAWIAGRLIQKSAPRLGRVTGILGVAALSAGAANLGIWIRGLDRQAVEFVSQGARLNGTLMLPTAVERPPVAIIVHGSPRLTRDFYAVWGRHLVREGVAVFVYDKRGTGASEGVVPRDNGDVEYLTQLGRDAAAAFSAVRALPGIDSARISLLGLSQGGWTAPVAASLQPDVFRLAFLSGPVATTHEEGAFSEVAGDGAGGSDDAAAIQAGDRAAAAAPPGGFDPLPFIARSNAPGRWFYGDRDRSIPVSLSTGRLRDLTAAGRNVEAVIIAGGDHLLFRPTRIPLGFAEPLMPQLVAWLRGDQR